MSYSYNEQSMALEGAPSLKAITGDNGEAKVFHMASVIAVIIITFLVVKKQYTSGSTKKMLICAIVGTVISTVFADRYYDKYIMKHQ